VNGHANSFGFWKRRLIHTYTYGAMTRALTREEVQRLGGQARWAMTPADPMGTTVRRISGTGGDRWGGALCLSWNNVPAFGEIEPFLYSAVCQNGLGTVKGTLSGMMAAERACDTGSNLLADFSDQPAPRLLPPDLLTRIGATMRIRWQERRAGRDL